MKKLAAFFLVALVVATSRLARRIFTEEGRRLGCAFTDETRVVFEDFRVIWRGEENPYRE